MTPSDRSLSDLFNFALDTVWEAGKITLQHFQTRIEVETKNDRSPVTIADRKTEQFLRERIASTFPGHAVVGEEYGAGGPETASHRWIIDPIDGTKSFIRGVPFYGTMLGLERDGEAVVGAIAFPALGEVVGGAEGHGTTLNGRRVRVSPCDSLSKALLLCTDYAHYPRAGKQEAFERLCAATALQRTWGDCYGHCLVATGRAELMLDAGMHVWDCAALLPILRGAGGTFTDWTGVSTIHGPDAISSNGVLLDSILKTIRGNPVP